MLSGDYLSSPPSVPSLLCGTPHAYTDIQRHSNSGSNDKQIYTIELPTSAGNLSVPQLGGNLTLEGKDSKVFVVDYAAGSTHLVYSTGEVMTWYATSFCVALR